MGKQAVMLLDALKEGSATAPELAAEFGIDSHVASAQLSNLYQLGLVTRKKAPALNPLRGAKPYLYSAAG